MYMVPFCVAALGWRSEDSAFASSPSDALPEDYHKTEMNAREATARKAFGRCVARIAVGWARIAVVGPR